MEWGPTSLAAFGPAAVAAILLAVYLYVGEPVVGLVLHRRFERLVLQRPTARRWLYSRLLVLEWGLVALVLAVLVVSTGLTPASYGLRLPAGGFGWTVSLVVVVLSIVLLVVTVRMVGLMVQEGPGPAADRLLGSASVMAMLPRTTRERRLFGWVALTAGFAEELVYRGFFLAVVAALLPAALVVVWVAIVSVAFGLAHCYQGPAAMVGTMVLGALLAVLYLVSGSLLAPVVLHAAIDLRALALGRLVAQRSRRDRRGDVDDRAETEPEPVRREVRDSDSAALIELISTCFAEYPGCVMDVDGEEPWLRRPASAYTEAHGTMWVYTLGGPDGPVVACGGLKAVAPGRYELKNLYVVAAARRHGLGGELTDLVEDTARALGGTVVQLWTDTRFTDAHRLYERHGYVRQPQTRDLHDLSHTTEYFYEKALDR